MDPRTTTSGRAADRRDRAARSRRRPPAAVRRPGLYLGVAAAGALLVDVLIGVDPAAQAEAGTPESVSVAQQLGLSARSGPAAGETADLQPLERLAASRSSRDAEQSAAQQAQAAAEQAALEQQQAEAAARAAAETAAAAAQQQEQQAGRTAAAAAPTPTAAAVEASVTART